MRLLCSTHWGTLTVAALCAGGAWAQDQAPPTAREQTPATRTDAARDAADRDTTAPSDARQRMRDDQAQHEDRMARIARLREIAQRRGERERLDRLQRLEDRERSLHRARVERSRRDLGDDVFDGDQRRVNDERVDRDSWSVRQREARARAERATDRSDPARRDVAGRGEETSSDGRRTAAGLDEERRRATAVGEEARRADRRDEENRRADRRDEELRDDDPATARRDVTRDRGTGANPDDPDTTSDGRRTTETGLDRDRRRAEAASDDARTEADTDATRARLAARDQERRRSPDRDAADVGDDGVNDAASDARRRLAQAQSDHEIRMARIARLRSIAEKREDSQDRLDALRRLEDRQRQLHRERLASARADLGDDEFAREVARIDRDRVGRDRWRTDVDRVGRDRDARGGTDRVRTDRRDVRDTAGRTRVGRPDRAGGTDIGGGRDRGGSGGRDGSGGSRSVRPNPGGRGR